MKNPLLILMVLLSLTLTSQNDIPIPVQRPADFEYLSAPDSLGKRTFIKTPNSSASRNQAYQLKIPYPIIFIHGLNSNSDTWYDQANYMYLNYGLSYGGRFDYCLNYNGNDASANANFWPASNADLAIFTGTWTSGDYYWINFDIGNDGAFHPNSLGSNYVLSDQSAIVKQGRAIRDAIYRVLQLTGRDKVVLMGHSMGGLAAREYLQNPSNWQSDGKTHVAKLVTTGTPHGGSNATSFGIISSNTEGQSEAIRDLRRTYYWSNNSGVYLFGGIENLPYMNDQTCCYFYNSDVNCNGTGGTNENITGLNQKSIDYYGMDYSYIIGQCSGCIGTTNPGDGIVWDVCANLNNYYSGLTNNLFFYNASAAIEIHTDLPKQFYQNMQGLDEPNEYFLSYNIGFDTIYTGFTTIQPINGYPYDYDDYAFKVSGNSIVTVNINNISLSNLMARIVESNTNNIGATYQSSGNSSLTFTQTVSSGNYYLEIFGTPTSSSYFYPYKFTLSQTPSGIGIAELNMDKYIHVYPNPVLNTLYISAKENFETRTEIEIINTLGQIVLKFPYKSEIDVSQLLSGYYTIKLSSASLMYYSKFIKE